MQLTKTYPPDDKSKTLLITIKQNITKFAWRKIVRPVYIHDNLS